MLPSRVLTVADDISDTVNLFIVACNLSFTTFLKIVMQKKSPRKLDIPVLLNK